MSDLVHFMPVRAWDRNGFFSPGATAEFFEPSTTTPRTVYADAGLSVAHPTPIVADARGMFPAVYTSGPVKALLKNADGLTLPGYPLDPALTVSADTAGASAISFEPTGQIQANDVQEAIERVQANIGTAISTLGLGITGAAPLLSSFDSANTPSGAVYRFDKAVTTGTSPSTWGGAEVGVYMFLRLNEDSGIAIGAGLTDGILWARTLATGAWGSWAIVTPQFLSQAQVEDAASTVQGTVSGQRLAQAITAFLAASTYTSSDQTITTSGVRTLTHGLGGRPAFVQYYLVCQADEAGYSAGDVIAVSFNNGTTATNKFSTATITATQIIIRYADSAGCFSVGHKDTGNGTDLTNGNWRLRVVARR